MRRRGPGYWEDVVAKIIRGDTIPHSAGYRLLYLPMHPAAHRGYVYEHRVVAERKIGRYLAADEQVHHLNGDTCDNRPENLDVLLPPEHSDAHAEFSDAQVKAFLIGGATYPQLTAQGISGHRVRRLRKELGFPKFARQDGPRLGAHREVAA